MRSLHCQHWTKMMLERHLRGDWAELRARPRFQDGRLGKITGELNSNSQAKSHSMFFPHHRAGFEFARDRCSHLSTVPGYPKFNGKHLITTTRQILGSTALRIDPPMEKIRSKLGGSTLAAMVRDFATLENKSLGRSFRFGLSLCLRLRRVLSRKFPCRWKRGKQMDA